MNSEQIFSILLLLSPFIVGGIIAAINNDSINAKTENIEYWFRKKKSGNRERSGYSRFIVNPIYYILVKFADWTDSLNHRGLKNGVRVALTLALVLIWIGLLIYATVMIIALVVVFYLYKIAFSMIFGESTNSTSSQSPHLDQRGKDMYKNDGWFGEKKEGRIDEGGNVYKQDGWFGEKKTGRIDDDGKVFKKEGLFGEKETGHITEDGNVYKKEGLFGEKKTGRIDNDGNIFEGDSWWNETKTGKTE